MKAIFKIFFLISTILNIESHSQTSETIFNQIRSISELRQSFGSEKTDTAIESEARRFINQKIYSKNKIDVTSFDGNVFLTGNASTQNKNQIESFIKELNNVDIIINDIQTLDNSPSDSQTQVTFIKSKSDLRRNYHTLINDSNIEIESSKFIRNQITNEDKISIAVYDGSVLLIGNSSVKKGTEIANGIKAIGNVKRVVNEIKPLENFHSNEISNDSKILWSYYSKLSLSKLIDKNIIRAAISNNTIYLVGKVSSEEANLATSIARETIGVSRVVRVFHVMSANEIAALTNENKAERESLAKIKIKEQEEQSQFVLNQSKLEQQLREEKEKEIAIQAAEMKSKSEKEKNRIELIQAGEDDLKCKSFGAKQKTQAYVLCRATLTANRAEMLERQSSYRSMEQKIELLTTQLTDQENSRQQNRNKMEQEQKEQATAIQKSIVEEQKRSEKAAKLNAAQRYFEMAARLSQPQQAAPPGQSPYQTFNINGRSINCNTIGNITNCR